MGKLIVIDGLDGSGKATQANTLYKKLKESGYTVKLLSFPDYNSKSSELVKYYLSGNISKNPNDVNAYAAASFYACDRYISFKTKWESCTTDDTILIADRYISSNAIHQTAKLNRANWPEFLDWIYEYEYEKLGLPKEDYLIYLDMNPKISKQLINKRNKDNDKFEKADIHENNLEYLIKCREAAMFVAKIKSWDVIKCDNGKVPLDANIISQKIYNKIKENVLK